MARRSVQHAARAVREHARRSVHAHSHKGPRRATVIDTDDWAVELHDADTVLEADDLTLTQWVEKYHSDHVVDPGDTVLVTEMGDGEWIVHDVISDKAV